MSVPSQTSAADPPSARRERTTEDWLDSRQEVMARVERTLEIMREWGYVPTLGDLAETLVGGVVSTRVLEEAVAASPDVHMGDGFVWLTGSNELVAKSRTRVLSNQRLNGTAREIAQDFVENVVSLCPFVECTAVSGSVASGGYQQGDDIDFDFFVKRGTKYISYLIAILVGLKYSWRYRRSNIGHFRKIAFLPKVACINVVWPAEQTRPFVRQDAGLAFELMRCHPLYGSSRFREVVRDNRWIAQYFPQIDDREFFDAVRRRPGAVHRALATIGAVPRLLHLLEILSRFLSRVIYRMAQSMGARDPSAKARAAYLRRVKFPYEFFQD